MSGLCKLFHGTYDLSRHGPASLMRGGCYPRLCVALGWCGELGELGLIRNKKKNIVAGFSWNYEGDVKAIS